MLSKWKTSKRILNDNKSSTNKWHRGWNSYIVLIIHSKVSSNEIKITGLDVSPIFHLVSMQNLFYQKIPQISPTAKEQLVLA